MKLSMSVALALMLFLPSVATGENQHNWETATVISQDVTTYNAGAVAMPLGTGVAAVPIRRRSNIVVVETATERLTWSEAGKNTVILPVNGSVRFYRDGDWYIVLDSKDKKHKFGLIGMTTKQSQ